MFSRISQKLGGFAILVVLLAKPGRPAQDDPKIHDGEADLVLLGGKVITVDPNDSNNEAGPTTVEQLERMKRLGVIPVPTGAWIYLGHAAFKTQAKVPFFY